MPLNTNIFVSGVNRGQAPEWTGDRLRSRAGAAVNGSQSPVFTSILSASGRFYSQEYPWICQELSKKYCWKIDGYWWGLLTTTNNTEFFCQRELPWINRELREILIYPRITQMDTDWCPQADGLVRQKGTILHPHEADCRHAVDY